MAYRVPSSRTERFLTAARPRHGVVLCLVLAACATTERRAPRPDVAWHQADEPLPSSEVFDDLGTRAAFNGARIEEASAGSALRAREDERARRSFESAARRYQDFVAGHPGTGWDLVIRYHAARLLALANRGSDAAALAQLLANDPHANPKTRAMALLLATNALSDAGKLDPIRMVFSRERAGRKPEPRPLPAPWRAFVEATDVFLAGTDPARPEPGDRVLSAAQLAVVAAQAEFATDHFERARTRLEQVLRRWPDDAAVFESAARPYIETFLVTGDARGALDAAMRVRAIAEARGRAETTGAAGDKYEAVARAAREIEVDLRFDSAKALLDERPADSAAAFEALADTPGADAAAALNGAAIARERAGDPEKAMELRRRIVERHPDSWLAPDAALQVAARLAKQGAHVEAGVAYRDHARRWPGDSNRCVALRNGAVELDLAGREGEAAELYVAFGSDPRCAERSPDAAALALHVAGKQLLEARRRDEARDAFRKSVRVKGVTQPDVKRRVAESFRILQRLERGGGAGRRPPSAPREATP